MSLIIIVGLFFLIWSQQKMQSRLQVLEDQLLKKHEPTTPVVEAPPVFSPLPTPQASQPLPSPVLYEAPLFTPNVIVSAPQKDLVEKSELFLYTWFKEHTLIKIGGVFFFLGALWFVSFAINEGWLIPEIRIALGFALAVLLYVLGHVRAQSMPAHYVILTALGTALMCATVSAAQIMFALFHPAFALTILGASIGYTLYVAYQTNVQWLVYATATVGLLVPFLVGGVIVPLWILLYVFVLSFTILLIGFFNDIRGLTLLMVFGAFLYESYLLPITTPALLWLFVCLFSLLFFASITHTMMRFARPQVIDVIAFMVLGVGFASFASEIALSPSLSLCLASLLIAVTGYVMTERNVDASIVTVYALFSLAGILLATSFLFSGFTLVLAYIIEITASFFTVTYLGLPRKVVYGIASLYTLPLIGSLESFTSPSWNSGIWHVDALVLYSMFGALLFSALWLMHIRTVASQPWSRGMAAVFGILSFFFIYGVVSVVMQSLFSWSEARVTTYVLWALISLGYILYSLRAKVPASVAYVSTLSLGIPLFASIPSFVSGAWLDGVRHIDSFGVFSITIILGLTALLITERYCKEYDRTYGRLLAGVCVVSIGYFFAVLYAFWHGLFTDFTIAHVAVYVSYAIVLYSLTAVFVLLRATISWIEFTLVAFVLPVLMSLSSINVHGWSEGVLSPDAVGLYGLATLCVMIGFGLKNKYTASSEAAATRITMWSRTFFILTFVYSIVLVWCLSQSVIIGEEAVSVALFVYTISGLFAYQYGRRNMKRDFTYAGVALLSLVVFRLVLVDVWQMEVLSRIITFLGIGFLFIAAALFEKLPGKQ